MTAQRILIVEDEKKLADLLADYLQQSNFQTVWVADGNDVIEQIKQQRPDAVLLDLMLPGKDGLTLCKEIRLFSAIPILITTARADEIDRLLGLELGADDYICKPFSPREVVARVKAVLRRASGNAKQQRADLALDENCLQLSYQGKTLSLTAVEFQLLKPLASAPGRIYSRNQLMDAMYTDNRIVSDRTIDSHIKKLRKKLARTYPDTEFIHSVYGAGYRFDIQP